MHMLILCLCVTAAFAAPSSVWQNYKMTYSKVYDNPLDEQLREEIFQKTVDFIETHNMEADMGMHTYWVGLNEFSDWTDQEYNALLGLRMPAKDTEAQVGVQGPVLSDIDWRERGAITPMKNQGSCGSCWAFAAVSSVEGIWKVKRGTLLNLSEQQLVDCSHAYGNRGCGGGWHHWAYNYIRDAGGIVESQHYRYTARQICPTLFSNTIIHRNSKLGMIVPPYKESDGFVQRNEDFKIMQDETCKFSSVKDRVKVKVTGYRATDKSEAGLAGALSSEGPVGVALDASRNGFRNYRSGVYDDPGCSKRRFNHAVSAIGYKSNAWIVRNSWGTRWGNQGYILMKRGYNICGIATHAYYPTV